MNETRKIAAILAADVVGYSRLAGGDHRKIPLAGNLGDSSSPAARSP
jgi:hypothetical protein